MPAEVECARTASKLYSSPTTLRCMLPFGLVLLVLVHRALCALTRSLICQLGVNGGYEVAAVILTDHRGDAV